MRYHAVIDTNMIVSGVLPSRPDSPPKRIMESIINGRIVPIHSRYLLGEYRGVLQRDKFRLDGNDVDILVGFLESVGVSVEPETCDYALPDPKDSPIYAVMMSSAEYNPYLVTGNIRHFPETEKIVTPKEMMDILDADDGRTGPGDTGARPRGMDAGAVRHGSLTPFYIRVPPLRGHGKEA